MSLDIDPVNLKAFGFWGAILVLKILIVPLLTIRQRFRKQVFSNPEDARGVGGKKAKVVYDDLDVERVRRSHLNDLENVVPWFLATLIWLGTGPSTWLAGLLIRTFVISRIIYTVVYVVVPLPQPARGLAWATGYLITVYMAAATLLHYYD